MLLDLMVYVEIAIVAVLICLNGLLAMSELAVVSARPARLKTMIDRNVKGAGRALRSAPIRDVFSRLSRSASPLSQCSPVHFPAPRSAIALPKS